MWTCVGSRWPVTIRDAGLDSLFFLLPQVRNGQKQKGKPGDGNPKLPQSDEGVQLFSLFTLHF